MDALRQLDNMLKNLTLLASLEDKNVVDKVSGSSIYDYFNSVNNNLFNMSFSGDLSSYVARLEMSLIDKKTFINDKFKKMIKKSDKYFGKYGQVAFNPESMKSFCIFKKGSVDDERCTKLYIPVKQEKIEEVSEKLFVFLGENDISHQTKIKGKSSYDNIVLRTDKLGDAKKIIDFINNDDYFADKMMDVKPTMLTEGRVGITKDGNESYTDVISVELMQYLYECKTKGALRTVSIDGFVKHLDRSQINADRKGICELFSLKLKGKDGFDSYASYYQNKYGIDNSYKPSIVKNINVGIVDKDIKLNKDGLLVEDKFKYFEDAVMVTYAKYDMKNGDYRQVASAIKNYMLDGNANLFSNGVDKTREKLIRNVSVDEVRNHYNDGSERMSDDLCRKLVKHIIDKNVNKDEDKNLSDKMKLFDKAIGDTYAKYDEINGNYNNTLLAVYDYLNDGLVNRITRDNNGRDNLKGVVTKEDVRKFYNIPLGDVSKEDCLRITVESINNSRSVVNNDFSK